MTKTKFLSIVTALVALLAVLMPSAASAQDTKEFGTDRSDGGNGTPWGGPGDYSTNQPDTCLGERITIRAQEGIATLGTNGDDVIAGTDGPDTIYGYGGNDIICGFDGDDIIYGDTAVMEHGEGNDQINGGKGHDTIYGGPWNDTIHGASGQDWIHGDLPGAKDGGQDWIYGGQDNDHIIGGFGVDFLWGDRWTDGVYAKEDGYGDDTIDSVTDNSEFGYDEIWAGAGNDTIVTNDGVGQIMYAGSGNDVCYIDDKIDYETGCEILP